ncbi:MAG: replicative DNA helicase [Verrucomicrobiales bacterium]
MPSPPVTQPPSSSPVGEDTPSLLKTAKGSATFTQDLSRPMPSSVDAERGVLSCMIQSCAHQSPENLIGIAIEKIGDENFFVEANRILFKLLVELHDANKPIDLITLTQVLIDRKLLDKIGGPSAITEITSFAPTTAHFDYYLEIVKGKSVLRRIIASCSEAINRAYEDQEDIPGLLDEVERNILAVREGDQSGESFSSMKEEVMVAIEHIEKLYQSKDSITGLRTGFRDFDEMTNGLHPGEMVIIAARPSMGKTSLAMNIVEHVAIEQGKPVAVFSLEMGTQQLVQRLICSRAEIQMQKLAGGFLKKSDFPRIMDVANVLAASPIFIDDSPALTILELRAKARRLKKMTEDKLALIAVDYLQLLRSTSKRGQENRQIEISEISSGLKALSKELHIPVLVLAQLNRGPESRDGGKPRLSDLRESGSIEQDADVVGLLVRSEYYAGDAEEREEIEGEAELIIAKQRNGPTGEIPLTFIKSAMRFVDRAVEHDFQ